MSGQPLLSAVLLPGKGFYRAPPWLQGKVGHDVARWCVVALDRAGVEINRSVWRFLKIQN